MKKHYGLIIAIFLVLLWGGYIAFWDASDRPAGAEITPTQPGDDKNTPAPTAPAPSSAATPTVTIKPTAAATPVPTPEPEPTAADEPDVSPTPSLDPTMSPTPTTQPTPTSVASGIDSFNMVIANVSIHLNVRSEPNENSDIIGMMEPDAWAEVIERGEEWTKIKSGDITGYAFNQYLLSGQSAVNRARQLNALFVEVAADTMNIRAEKNTDCEIIRQAVKGESFTYIPEKSDAEWIAIQYDADTVAYLASNWARTYLALPTAIEAQ